MIRREEARKSGLETGLLVCLSSLTSCACCVPRLPSLILYSGEILV